MTNLTDSRVATRSQKISQSLIGRVGTNLGKHFTDEHKKNISNALKGQKRGKLSAERHKTFVQKCDSTRRRNHTFNTSKAESQMCEALKIQYSGCTVLTQYKDTRYPFNCDFYVVEKDLFIELNAHWTRGGQPYDPDNPECQKQLLEWQEKAKTSKYYQNAIYVWTDLDVRKRKIAEENKLNYQVLYWTIKSNTLIKYIYGSNKGETKQGDVINDPFRLGNVDVNFTSSKVVEAEPAVATSGKVEGTLNWTPIIKGAVEFVIGATTFRDGGDGKIYKGRKVATVNTTDEFGNIIPAGTVIEAGTVVSGGTIDYVTGAYSFTDATLTESTVVMCNYAYDNVVIPQHDLPTVSAKMEAMPLIAKARRVAI